MNELTLFGGNPVIQTPFPEWPIFDQQEVQAVRAIAESGQWWMGKNGHPVVAKLESAFASFQGTRYALAMTNSTHGMEIILRNLGIGPGDEVIVPAYTLISTATAVLMVGATPIPADVQPQTMTLDPEAFRLAITPRTRAVIPVHLAGVAGAIDEIIKIAEKHKIFIVEDCTHAHGAESKGRRVGSLGIASSFSFQSSMMVPAGEGGIIVTSDTDLYKKCWSQHNCGRRHGRPRGEYYEVGTNYRIASFQAAMIQVQLQRFAAQIPKRLHNIEILDKGLTQIEGITPQYRHPQDKVPAYLYLFYYNPKSFNGLPRHLFVKALQAEGVPCHLPDYPLIHKTSLFQHRNFGPAGQSITQDLTGHPLPNYAGLSFANAERVADETVCLPHTTMLGEPQQVQGIVEAVQKIQKYSHIKSGYNVETLHATSLQMRYSGYIDTGFGIKT